MTPFMTAVERLQIGCIQLMLTRKDLDFSLQDIYVTIFHCHLRLFLLFTVLCLKGFDVHKFAQAADQLNVTGLQKALLDKSMKLLHDELR